VVGSLGSRRRGAEERRVRGEGVARRSGVGGVLVGREVRSVLGEGKKESVVVVGGGGGGAGEVEFRRGQSSES
jgi:hypothetical protein